MALISAISERLRQPALLDLREALERLRWPRFRRPELPGVTEEVAEEPIILYEEVLVVDQVKAGREAYSYAELPLEELQNLDPRARYIHSSKIHKIKGGVLGAIVSPIVVYPLVAVATGAAQFALAMTFTLGLSGGAALGVWLGQRAAPRPLWVFRRCPAEEAKAAVAAKDAVEDGEGKVSIPAVVGRAVVTAKPARLEPVIPPALLQNYKAKGNVMAIRGQYLFHLTKQVHARRHFRNRNQKWQKYTFGALVAVIVAALVLLFMFFFATQDEGGGTAPTGSVSATKEWVV